MSIPEKVVRCRLAAVSRQAVVSYGCLLDFGVAMARVRLADLEKRDGWNHVIAQGVSILCHQGIGRVSVGGV